MIIKHGVYVSEKSTTITTPKTSTSGIQVVIGTAPVNLCSDIEHSVNVPKLCYDMKDATSQLGYSEDFESYSLCQSMKACFELYGVAPVIFINVLDPKKHITDITTSEVSISAKQATVSEKGILLTSVSLKNGAVDLTAGTDYITTFDDGNLVVTVLDAGKAATATKLQIVGKKLDPSAVTASDVIGGYNSETGFESGLQVIRQVYPLFGIKASLIIAPGYSHIPAVGAVIEAKCEEINGVFAAECILDLESTTTKKYTDVQETKKTAGYASKHSYLVWPKAKIDDVIYYGSAIAAAITQYTDYTNGDVPNVSPSNKEAKIDAAVLADGTEVIMDTEQANVLNASGIGTFVNMQGWKLWGNYSACYPENTDIKDKWWNIRRFFTWHGNNFITDYFAKVDNVSNKRLIEALCDEENIKCNGYVSAGICAAASISFSASDNSVENLVDGKLQFNQTISPYTPAQEIDNVLSFDPDALSTALLGGEE